MSGLSMAGRTAHLCVVLGAGLSLVACSSSSGSTNAASGGGSKDGSSADGGASGTPGNCTVADTNPCSSFTTPTEDGGTDTIMLGPYGAQADPNVGKGFENTTSASTEPGGTFCAGFASLFSENQKLTSMLLMTSDNGIMIDFSLYSVYHPAKWPSSPVPVITWGNGTCAQPEGYGALLRYVASYGYFVVAANTTQVGNGQAMLKALDYAAAANSDPTSPYYQKLDLSKIGAMGHSQGGSATAMAASDSRIKFVIDFNAVDSSIPKPYLAISGDKDITGFTAAGMMSAIDSSSVPAAYLYYHNPIGSSTDALKGHLVLMLTPWRVTSQTVAWWEMVFRNDAASIADFVGPNCGFCGQGMNATNAYEYGEQGLPPGSGSGSSTAADAATE